MHMSKKTSALVPRYRFPEFLLTDDWKDTYLGKISTILRGGSPRPIDEFLTNDANGLNWLKIGDVSKEAKYITRTSEKVKATALIKTREVNIGDLIMSNSMSFGRPYILEIKTCIHDGWIAVTEIKNSVISEYLYYFILSESSQTYFLNAAAGGGIKNLNAEIIKLLPVVFPQKAEQQKIADCLTSLDELIAAEDKKLALLKMHKIGLMQKLIHQEFRLKNEQGSDYPEWEDESLNDVCLAISSGKSKKDDRENGYPLYGSTGIIGRTNVADYEGEYLLVARVGANAGYSYAINGKCGISDNTLVINVDGKKAVLKYLSYFLYNFDLNRLIFGSGQPLVTGSQLKAIELRLPSIPEQQKIADCLTSLDELIAAEDKKLALLKTHKKGLMQGLFPSVQEVFG
jgi:type I restriction enzyme S subunit